MAGIVEAKLTLVTVDPLTFAGKSSDLYYFAYGSNMNKKQIHARCVHPKTVAVARLPHHQIAFFGYSRT